MTRLGLIRWLASHTSRLLPALSIAVLARIANQLLGTALFVLPAWGLVQAATGGSPRITVLLAWLIGLALAKALLRYLEHYAGHWVAFTALQRLRELFFARLVPQAPAAVRGRAGAELTETATRDIDRIEVFFAHTLPPAVSAVIVPAIALSWLGATQSGLLAAVLIPFVLCIVVLIPLLASRSTWRGARAVAAQRGELASHLGDDLQGIREILGFGIEEQRLAGLDEQDRALGAARVRAGVIAGLRSAAITAVEAAALLALLLTTIAADLGIGPLVIALAVAIGLRIPARGVDDFAVGLDAALAAADRLHRVVDAPPLITEPSGTAVEPRPAGADMEPDPAGGGVEFAAVTFAYPGSSEPVLHEVSLRAEPGTWSAVVGVSGSGKSTLAGLLLRGWDPQTGAVLLDGRSVADIPLEQLRSAVALAPQRPQLLRGSVAENLRLAAPGATDAALGEALRTVALDGWTADLPHGLDTPLGAGTELSGGQLQRLALARALLAQPQVLILDEALSQLDASTAETLRSQLSAEHHGLTIIEITHRTDLLPADMAVTVLDSGRVVDSGPVSRLRGSGGPFDLLTARVV